MEKIKPDCWNCKYFERFRTEAFCHGGKKVRKLPKKNWYSGRVKFCTFFEPINERSEDGET